MTTEMRLEQDEATVWVTETGAPERLAWRGRRFDVSAKPLPWIDRVPWWQSSPRVPSGGSGALLEQEMWQVQATAADGQILIFDLAQAVGPQWRVTAIYD